MTVARLGPTSAIKLEEHHERHSRADHGQADHRPDHPYRGATGLGKPSADVDVVAAGRLRQVVARSVELHPPGTVAPGPERAGVGEVAP